MRTISRRKEHRCRSIASVGQVCTHLLALAQLLRLFLFQELRGGLRLDLMVMELVAQLRDLGLGGQQEHSVDVVVLLLLRTDGSMQAASHGDR
eukprot:scaffold6786_cov384-Prasinococcus_capsulatus_cf.AAC.13